MKLMENRVAVVTGAASPRGIGRATAALLAERGARVAVVDVSAEAAAAAAATLGVGHRGYGCDVGDRAAVRATVERIRQDFAGIDSLFNYAGISRSTRILDIGEEEYEAVMRINLGGTMNMCQAVVPAMREAGRGSIICVGSVAALRGGGLFGSAHYAASKGGVHSLAKALARELGPDGIRVNAIAPGLIDTDIFQGKLTEEKRREIVAGIPLGRVGQPRDVAEVAVFLASDAASYLTGTIIDINGGGHIH
ncbi:MAG: SDR family oxidoreductase [Proteobacteria bacterium]|nr:SDR family oxidoreductase [Pseudomonadota bacterium]